jgi:hypothetical protein
MGALSVLIVKVICVWRLDEGNINPCRFNYYAIVEIYTY